MTTTQLAIDYRKARLGRRFAIGAIVICPKCGERGKMAGKKFFGIPGIEVYHYARRSPTLGCTVWDTDGYCSIRFDGPIYSRKAREAREKEAAAIEAAARPFGRPRRPKL